MATIDFPLSLQDKKPLRDNFQLQKGISKVEQTFDGGNTLARLRPIKSQDTMTISLALSTSELETFNTFYTDTLKEGTEAFNYTHPIQNNEIEVRILGTPSTSPIGPDDYQIVFNLIIINENN